jgi:hypothetical protein
MVTRQTSALAGAADSESVILSPCITQPGTEEYAVDNAVILQAQLSAGTAKHANDADDSASIPGTRAGIQLRRFRS